METCFFVPSMHYIMRARWLYVRERMEVFIITLVIMRARTHCFSTADSDARHIGRVHSPTRPQRVH